MVTDLIDRILHRSGAGTRRMLTPGKAAGTLWADEAQNAGRERPLAAHTLDLPQTFRKHSEIPRQIPGVSRQIADETDHQVSDNVRGPFRRKSLVVGVAGGTGAGKTTVARAIADAVGPERVAALPEDAYYREYAHLTEAERANINWDHPDAIEVSLLLDQIEKLVRGEPVERPVYDFAAYARASETVRVEPRPVLIVEGILIFTDARLRDLFDVKVFVDTDADLRFIRRLVRDVQERGRTVESVVMQYLATVRPMHIAFVEPTKRHADIIVPEGGENQVAIELLRGALLHHMRTDGE